MTVLLLLLGIIAFFVIAFIVLKRYNNPFKLIFLFGKKGSGKTTLAVKLGYKYMKKGYRLYSDSLNIQLPNVSYFDTKYLGDYVPPEKSCIILDEVGISYDARKFKQFKDTTRDFFKYQRQYRVVVICTSQTWDVDKKVRDLTDVMYLCTFLGPLSLARRIKRGFGLTDPLGESDSRIADTLKFTSPFLWRLTRIGRWSRYFVSFAPPSRPSLDEVCRSPGDCIAS